MKLPVFDDIRDQGARIYKPSKVLQLSIDFEKPIANSFNNESQEILKY